MGFPVDVFVNKSEAEKFLCAVCQGVAKEVCETDCGHLFCHSCVSRLIRTCAADESTQCPHCRASLTWDLLHMSRFLERQIQELRCQCLGCKQWTGPLSALADHFNKDCVDRLVRCEWHRYGCTQKVKFRLMKAHLKECETEHLRMKVVFMENAHKREIANLKKKHSAELERLQSRWTRKLLESHSASPFSSKMAGSTLMSLVSDTNASADDVDSALSGIEISSVHTTATRLQLLKAATVQSESTAKSGGDAQQSEKKRTAQKRRRRATAGSSLVAESGIRTAESSRQLRKRRKTNKRQRGEMASDSSQSTASGSETGLAARKRQKKGRLTKRYLSEERSATDVSSASLSDFDATDDGLFSS